MAAHVLMRNTETNEERAMYSADARELRAAPGGDEWVAVRQLDRDAKLVEAGVADDISQAGAVEFGRANAAAPPLPTNLTNEEIEGARGGGPQAPAESEDE